MARREILVFTEGKKTEVGYLLPWQREHRDHVLVTVDEFHGVPLSLVDRAAETRKAELREEKRGRGRAHDEFWCMFDVDEHPNVPDAIQKAAANGISLAVSNPCIELWFILHFEAQTAYIDRHRAQAKSLELLGCAKSLTPEAAGHLYGRFEDARERARDLVAKHHGDDSPTGANPSSSVWRLIDAILANPG